MSYKIEYEKRVIKFLEKLAKATPKDFMKIDIFIKEILANHQNPCLLPNAKHLKAFNENYYRWRLGIYRIIAIVKNEEFKIIQIIKIDKRDDKTYKNL